MKKKSFEDIPIDVSDKNKTDYLKTHQGIVIKSGVILGGIRDDKNNVLTPFLSCSSSSLVVTLLLSKHT